MHRVLEQQSDPRCFAPEASIRQKPVEQYPRDPAPLQQARKARHSALGPAPRAKCPYYCAVRSARCASGHFRRANRQARHKAGRFDSAGRIYRCSSRRCPASAERFRLEAARYCRCSRKPIHAGDKIHRAAGPFHHEFARARCAVIPDAVQPARPRQFRLVPILPGEFQKHLNAV